MTLLKGIVGLLVLANVAYFLWARDLRTSEAPAETAPATLRLASEGGVPSRPVGPAAQGASEPSGAGPALGSAAHPAGAGAPRGSDADRELLSNVKRCVTVGPFADVSQAAHAASTLRSAGYDPRQRVAEGEVWAGVWVYLPLPPTRAAGETLLTRLKAAGVEDALEMPGPNDSSVISLGLFSETRRAQARVAQIQSLGFNPALADRKRTGDVYWIDMDLKSTDALVKPSDLAGESGRIVRLEVKGCPVPQR